MPGVVPQQFLLRLAGCLSVLIIPVMAFGFSPDENNNTVQFLPNEGQWHEEVRYKARVPGGELYVSDHTLTYQFWDQEQLSRLHHRKDTGNNIIQGHVLKMSLEGAKANPVIQPANPSETRFNFFIGDDKTQWAPNLKGYQQLRLKDVYPGIDMVLKGKPGGIKYNFVVAPNADPSAIQMHWQGTPDLAVKDGRLQVQTALQPLIEDKPVAYRLGADYQRQQEVPCHFTVEADTARFAFPDQATTAQPLLIDPEVIFATYSGSYKDNFGFTGTFDADGAAYSGGTVYNRFDTTNRGFPATAGAFQDTFQGGKNTETSIARDVGILKYSPDGSKLLYATYLGGRHNEQPHSMIVNSNGELLIFGTTFSANFPALETAYQPDISGASDAFIAKLSPDGTTMRGATFLGGPGRDGLNGILPTNQRENRTILGYNYGDLYRGEVVIDEQDQVYIASSTQSRRFPTTLDAYRSNYRGGFQDGFAAKLGPDLEALRWSTFIGGGQADAAFSLIVNDQQQVYVTGGTKSPDLGDPGNGWQPNFKGKVDGYLLKLSKDGGEALASTYLGTTSFDQAYFVERGSQGSVFVTGQTEGEMPRKNANYHDQNSGQFISKFNSDLTELELSAQFGSEDGTPDIAPSAFLVDICGNIYVSGWGGATNRGSHSKANFLEDMPLTDQAYQTETDGSDFYLAAFRKGMDSLLYGTYIGGKLSDEHVDGGTSRFDRRGMAYQSICGGCGGNSDFPTTDGAYSEANNSFNCNNAFLKLKLDVANQAPLVKRASSEAEDVVTVQARDTLRYDLLVKDPDGDSVSLDVAGKALKSDSTRITEAQVNNMSEAVPYNATLFWPTDCSRVGDTFRFKVTGTDKGCPAPKQGFKTLKVYVDSLPNPNDPPVFCSSIEGPNTFRVTWDLIDNKPTISHYELMRVNPNGDTVRLDSLNPRQTSAYNDETAYGLRDQAYCYFLRTVNKCGKLENSSYTICTGSAYQRRPEAVKINNVTVMDNQHLKISWYRSQSNDFKAYQLLRKPNDTPDQRYEVYRTFDDRGDTSFIDRNSKVSQQSYCYRIRVKDVCGFYSKQGRRGCSIRLTGGSEPFAHTLFWNPYENWAAGIKHYRIFRRDPVVDTTFQPIATVQPDQITFKDDELNYKVGAYYYKVRAYEQSSAKTLKTSVSQSNTIYLEQEPLLHVPSAFTINRDGINERWGLEPVFVKDIHVMVFNRWGAMVYETNSQDDAWYGPEASSYPERMSDNVYLYQIFYKGWDGIQRKKTGDVTILK